MTDHSPTQQSAEHAPFAIERAYPAAPAPAAPVRGETRISASLATVEIEPAGEGARLLHTEQAVYLDGGDTPAIREHGAWELLERLAGTLADR